MAAPPADGQPISAVKLMAIDRGKRHRGAPGSSSSAAAPPVSQGGTPSVSQYRATYGTGPTQHSTPGPSLVQAGAPPPQQQVQAAAAAPLPQHACSQARQGNAILVNRNQQGNPLLKCLRNINYRHADVLPDYQINDRVAVLFLSLRFHKLQPLYIHGRIKALQHSFRAFLLVQCDVDDPTGTLAEVTKAAIDTNCTLLVAWSPLECARYLEVLKAYENKSADSIKPKIGSDYATRLASVMTAVRSVNKTDVTTMAANFQTLAQALAAPEASLASIPGLGPTKVRRLLDAFNTPFFPAAPASAGAHAADPPARSGPAASASLGRPPAGAPCAAVGQGPGGGPADAAAACAGAGAAPAARRAASAGTLGGKGGASAGSAAGAAAAGGAGVDGRGGRESGATASGASTSGAFRAVEAGEPGVDGVASHGGEAKGSGDAGAGAVLGDGGGVAELREGEDGEVDWDALQREWCATQEAGFDDEDDDDFVAFM